MLYILRFFFSSKCSLFHNANLFGSCIIHILYTGCDEIKKIIPAPKGYCHPFQHISLQRSKTKQSLAAKTGVPFPQLLCSRDTVTNSDRFSLFLVLQLRNITATVRSNNHHQRFIQQQTSNLANSTGYRSHTIGYIRSQLDS